MHHGVVFNFGSAKVCSPAIFETCFSFDKDIWIAATDYCMLPVDTLAAAARTEIFGVNALRGKLHQLGSPNLQDIFIGG